MSKYTTELRYLVESHFDLGLKDYPIFDEAYRETLNQKIINHYYFREIGMETAELFKMYLNMTMNEIMPYYNQLYKSELIKFNPLYNVDKFETADTDFNGSQDFTGNVKANGKTETTGTGTSTTNTDTTGTSDGTNSQENSDTTTTNSDTTTNSRSKNVNSDTPQGLLSIGDIEGEVYASQAQFINSTTSTNQNTSTNASGNLTGTDHNETAGHTTSVTNTETHENSTREDKTDTTGKTLTDNFTKYIRHVSGKAEGETYSEMLLKFRETFLNIDMMIINELNTCFMLLY